MAVYSALGTFAGGGFSPLSISGLQGWWDASATSTLFQQSDGTVPASSIGDPVGYWGDLSGNGRNAIQATTANKPTRNANGGIAFDGTNDSLSFSSIAMTAFTAFVVYDVVALTTASYLLGGTAQGVFSGGINVAFLGYGVFNDPLTRQANIEPLTRGVAMFKNTSLRRNGITPTYISAGNLASLTLSVLGGRTDASLFSNGRIFEVAIYNRDLTQAEVQDFEQYAIAKWGIV